MEGTRGRVIFRPELAEAVMEGRKTVTRRAVSGNPRSPYHASRVTALLRRSVAVQPGRGKPAIGRVRVTRVTWEEFEPAHVRHPEAAREGFPTVAAFRETWKALHGSLRPVGVWRIELGDPKPERGR